MLTQLQTPLPLQTPKGKAWAVAVIDYGPHWDLMWVTFVLATGECWTFANKDVRQERNESYNLPEPVPYEEARTVNEGKRLPFPHPRAVKG